MNNDKYQSIENKQLNKKTTKPYLFHLKYNHSKFHILNKDFLIAGILFLYVFQEFILLFMTLLVTSLRKIFLSFCRMDTSE